METNNYNKISGKKTLILVVILIVAIILLSFYSIFLVFRKSSVITNSSYFEKPISIPTPTQVKEQIPDSFQIQGD